MRHWTRVSSYQIDRQTDRQTACLERDERLDSSKQVSDRQTDRQIGRQTYTQLAWKEMRHWTRVKNYQTDR